MPVSVTAIVSLATPATRSPVTSTSTWPSSVNFTALPSRLVTIWRMRPTSPMNRPAEPRLDAHDELEVLFLGARRHQRRHVLDRLGKVEGRRIERQLAGIDLGEIQDVVDDGQQRVARLDDDVGERLLLRVESDLASSSAMPSTPFIGVRISWLILARNSDLARSAASALQQRCGCLGEGAADRLLHRPEDPEADERQHREQQAAGPQTAGGRCDGVGQRRAHGRGRCGRGSASAGRTGRSGCGFRGSSIRPIFAPPSSQVEVAHHVARRPEQVAVHRSRIELVDGLGRKASASGSRARAVSASISRGQPRPTWPRAAAGKRRRGFRPARRWRWSRRNVAALRRSRVNADELAAERVDIVAEAN